MGANNANLSWKSFGYDALGRKTSEGAQRGGTATMRYDAAGRRTQLTWADDFYVSYDYDAADALVAIRENGATSGTGVLARYGYDDLGRRVTRTLGNGLVASYGYDAVSRLTGLTTSGAGGNAVTLGGYNPAGQIGTRSGSNDSYAWGGAVNVSRAYASNGLNQYTQSGAVTPSYDTRGNLTGAGGAGYSYNARNLLTGFGTSGAFVYYNPLSQLLDVSTERAWMVYDGARTIAEMSYDGPLTRRYVWGPGADDLVLWYEGTGTSQRRWADLDERGSTTRISNDAGATLWINTYDEYGIPGAGNAGRFQYTGQAWLPSLGMYNYKARIYSPTLGRFLQTDPIGYGDGMNWHDYVGGDPVNNTDPTGLQDAGVVTVTGSVNCGLHSSDPRCGGGSSRIDWNIYNIGSANDTLARDLFLEAKEERERQYCDYVGWDACRVVGGTQNVVSDVLNHDIGADIVVVANKVPKPVQNFISDYIINYDCGFISSASCSGSDYLSAGLLLSGSGLVGNVAVEGPKAALFKYGKGRAGQIRFFEDRLIFRLDVNKPITHMNIQGRMFGVTFNIHFPKW